MHTLRKIYIIISLPYLNLSRVYVVRTNEFTLMGHACENMIQVIYVITVILFRQMKFIIEILQINIRNNQTTCENILRKLLNI